MPAAPSITELCQAPGGARARATSPGQEQGWCPKEKWAGEKEKWASPATRCGCLKWDWASQRVIRTAAMGSWKGQRLGTCGRFPFPGRHKKVMLKINKDIYPGRLSNGLYWWLLVGSSPRWVFCHPVPLLADREGCQGGIYGDGGRWGARSCPVPAASPCAPAATRPGAAVPAAFEGSTSSSIFISIFIQCLSRRCTDPLQWRKKRTRNLFSKDIQIS